MLSGLVNVTLFAIIFFPDPAVRQPAAAAVLFTPQTIYGWYAWSRQSSNHEAELQIRWLPRSDAGLAGGLRGSDRHR